MHIAQRTDRWVVRIVTCILVLVSGFVIRSACREDRGPRYLMVDELVKKRLGSELGREVRVHGFIKPGTIGHGANESWFVLQKNGVAIRVLARAAWPKCLRSNSEVVVHGTLRVDANGWYLDVTELLNRCPSKYIGARELGARDDCGPTTNLDRTYR